MRKAVGIVFLVLIAWAFFSSDGAVHEVRVDSANVRKLPGRSHPVVGGLKLGDRVQEIDARENWLKVRHKLGRNQLEGWVHRSLLNLHKSGTPRLNLPLLIFMLGLAGLGWIIFARRRRRHKEPSRRRDLEDSINLRVTTSDHSPVPRGKREKKAKWVKSGQAITIKSHTVSEGLIYVGEVLEGEYNYQDDACLINPKLKVVAAEPWEGGEEMGYWPYYSEIPAECRGAYLSWLAGGRVEPEAYIGYVFLFFYGLERRLLVDGRKGEVSETERLEIVDEIRRLLDIYGGSRSFRGYANNLLGMEWVLFRNDTPIPDYIDLNDRFCAEPFQMLLARQVDSGEPLTAKIALQWLSLHPEFHLRTPARRCPEEFGQLFARRYAAEFDGGMVVKPNRKRLKLDYYAASPSLRGGLNLTFPELPDPFLLTAPVKPLANLAEECTVELEAYSRFIGKQSNNPNSIAALGLLPKELIKNHSCFKPTRKRLAGVCADGPEFLDFETFYGWFDETPPAQFGKKECDSLGGLLDGLGYGIAPDMRHHNVKPTLDGGAVFFPKGHGEGFEASGTFQVVGIFLQMGAMVSQIDEEVAESEAATLQDLVEKNRDLTEPERDSLLAFLHWCLNTPQSTSGLKQRLSGLSAREKNQVGHFLISVAHVDGRIDAREVKLLEKLYPMLGLKKDQVSNDLHAMAASSGPVLVGKRDSDSEFSIPRPSPSNGSTASQGFQLNENLIRIREKETQQVKSVLEGIFSEQSEGEQPPPPEAPPGSTLDVLDSAHQNLFHKLLEQETWERKTLLGICRDLGLMIDGALEVINEWAFENANAPLIEDGEPVLVDVSLAKEILNAS